jgi:hypothetical protein
MGESSAATVREIEDVRERLTSNLEELERRMPAPAIWAKRAAGIAVGSGVSALLLRQAFKRVKKRRTAKQKLGAAVGGLAPAQAVIQVVPDDVAERIAEAFEDGRWKQWAAAGAGVWLVLRLLELRQLRKVNRALIAGRV